MYGINLMEISVVVVVVGGAAAMMDWTGPRNREKIALGLWSQIDFRSFNFPCVCAQDEFN